MNRNTVLRGLVACAFALLLCQCRSKPRRQIYISVPQQRLGLYDTEGEMVAVFPVSTSKFGVGDRRGSNCTPLGRFVIQEKIGYGMPLGMVFKGRRPTGEILAPNQPGRDPVVTRIMWLRGLDSYNRNAYGRYIYIHGTPEERFIGRPASYGCIRMRSFDVVRLFDRVSSGTPVAITTGALPRSTAHGGRSASSSQDSRSKPASSTRKR